MKKKVLPGVYETLGDIPTKTFNVNYFNFSFSFPQAIDIIRKAKKESDLVYVNISSGTKIASVAFFLAACLEGVMVYFIVPERYHVIFTDQIPKILAEEKNEKMQIRKIRKLFNEWGMNYMSLGAKEIIYLPTPFFKGHDEKTRALLCALSDIGGKIDSMESFVDFLEKNKYSS